MKPVLVALLCLLCKLAVPMAVADTPDDHIAISCRKELNLFCQGSNNVNRVDCLFGSKDQLGEDCSSALLAAASGKCHKDVGKYCASWDTVPDIRACLLRRMDQVDPECRTNLLRGSNTYNLAAILEEKYFQRLALVVAMCAFYLAVLTIAVIWTHCRARSMQLQMREFVRMKVDEELYLARDGSDSQPTEAKPDHNGGTNQTVQVGLQNISYRASPQDASYSAPVKRITATFHSGSLTAVIGSGADTVTRLLAGRLNQGVLRGQLIWNGLPVTAAQLSHISLAQGYVDPVRRPASQLTGLTVWQVLAHEAMLRLPDALGTDAILARAWTVLGEVASRDSAQMLCSSTTISQLRMFRLCVGIELLNSPALLVCPLQQWSLDPAERLEALQLLSALCSCRNIAVVVSLPVEAMDAATSLVDNLVLLDAEGELICTGPPVEIRELVRETFFSPNESLGSIVACLARPAAANQHGRYVEDRGEDERAGLLDEEGVEMVSPPSAGTSSACECGAEMRRRYLQSARHETVLSGLTATEPTVCGGVNSDSDVIHAAENGLTGRHRVPDEHSRERGLRIGRLGRTGVPPLKQIVVSLSVYSMRTSWAQHLLCGVAAAVPTLVLAIAFHREAQRHLTDAERAAGLLYGAGLCAVLLLSSHTLFDRSARLPVLTGDVSAWAHMLSSVLKDFPLAVIVSITLVATVYTMHPMNPKEVNIVFALVCLVVGLSAWQAMVTFFEVYFASTLRGVIVTTGVVVFSTLVNGQLVSVSELPWVVQTVAYACIPAVLQRALVSNDLRCCYLTLTCNAWLHEVSPNAHLECPAALWFSGNGWDDGNLGRMDLASRGMSNDRPMFLLFVLLLHGVSWRVATAQLLRRKARVSSRLVHDTASDG